MDGRAAAHSLPPAGQSTEPGKPHNNNEALSIHAAAGQHCRLNYLSPLPHRVCRVRLLNRSAVPLLVRAALRQALLTRLERRLAIVGGEGLGGVWCWCVGVGNWRLAGGQLLLRVLLRWLGASCAPPPQACHHAAAAPPPE